MHALKPLILLASLPLVLGIAQAQQSDDAAPTSPQANASLVGGGLSRALGTILEGPYDTESYPPGDNRELGVEYLDNSYFVSGAGTGGLNYRIHRFDALNPPPSHLWYMGSWPQTTMSVDWGGRDMESNNKDLLWVGADNGEVSEYSWDGANLTWVQYYVYAMNKTFRAFCQTSTGPACTGGPPFWYTASFTGSIFQCLAQDPAGTVCASYANPGLLIYGAGYDEATDTIWWWSQDGPKDREVTATEWDHNTQALTGRSFLGAAVPPYTLAGGADIYCDRFENLALVGLHQGAPDSIVVYELILHSDYCCKPVFYCTPKVSSSGCVPTMQTQGPPPLPPNTGYPTTGACDYSVIAVNVEAAKPGIIFYGYGPAAIPFQCSYLCVQPPIKRTPPQFSGGTTPCTGTLSYTVNCPGDPPGTFTYWQAWFRDPADPCSGTGLSDAVELQFR